MNVGTAGGVFTVEIVDAIHGTVAATKTVYLAPGPDQENSAPNAFAEFTYSSKMGAYVARIPAHAPEWGDPRSGDPGYTQTLPTVAISLQIRNDNTQGEVALEELHLVHEGLKLD